jgi:hypothetical protein
MAGLSLLIDSFNEKNPERVSEYRFCLEANKRLFDRVVVFREGTPTWADDAMNVEFVTRQKRLSFQEAIRWGGANLSGPFVIANSDIEFKSDVANAWHIKPGVIGYVTRWNNAGGCWTHGWTNEKSVGSGWPLYGYDAWCLCPPVRPVASETYLGTSCCDYVNTHHFLLAGYRVANISKFVTAWHHHAHRSIEVESSRPKAEGEFYVDIHPVIIGHLAELDGLL